MHPNILLLLLLFTIYSRTRAQGPDCLGHVDPTEYPTCQLIDHSSDSYECITKWENSIYLLKDGNVTLDCTAPFPLNMNYEGVKPIKNFHLEFYKIVLPNGGSEDSKLSYGVKVHLVTKNIEYSGDYIFHPLGKPEKNVTVYVFAEKKDLPQFLDLQDGKPVLDAFVDPTDPTSIVIPCRSSNYNATILGVYLNYEDLKEQIDGVNFRYDPRRGFIRKIPPEDSEDDIYGLYECYTEWKSSGRDRKKVRAKNPAEEEVPDEESGTDEHSYVSTVTSTESPKGPLANVTKLQGLVSFHPLPDKRFRAECTMPVDLVKGHTPFFASALMENPTSAHLNVKCSHLDSSCGENVRVMGNVTKPPNVLEIHVVHPEGLVQCAVSTNAEILEYFTGADDQIYFDWNEALAKEGLVKVIPADPSAHYTPQKNFEFICRFPPYVAVYPVWWALKYQNGTLLESYESSSRKSITLEMEVAEVHCGVTLWNSTVWYKASLSVAVVDLPVLAEQNRRMKFKTDAVNQALKCEAEAGPQAKLEWFRQGKKVDNIPMMELDQGKSLVLFFERINSTYEGNYTCRATTAQGSVDADFEIVLDKKPGKDPEDQDYEDGSANCTHGMRNLRLYHSGNGTEVDSPNSINQEEILLLKFPPSSRNCTKSEKSLEEILVQVIPKEGLHTHKIQMEDKEGHSSHQLGRSEAVNLAEDGQAQKKTKDLYHYLLPFVIGLSLILLVLILTYATYCYFVAPWKVRKISTVSNGPLI